MTTSAPRGDGVIWNPDVECASPAERLRAATAAWRRLADGLCERAPFYRRKFDDAGIDVRRIADIADLRRLPLTTKDELRASQEATPPFGEHLGVDPAEVKRVYQTSGSSGRPSVIALTRRDIGTWIDIGTTSYVATGVRERHALLTTFGAGPFVAGCTHEVFDRIGARRVPIAPGDTARVLSSLERGLVDTMLTTPSFVLHLAGVIERQGIDGRALGLERIVTAGEPGGGLPTLRARMQDAFGAEVVEAMGLGDVSPSLFGECSTQDGMHFGGHPFVWPELIDPVSAEPLAIESGVVGEPVYTTLVREAMPVVRFRSRDIVEVRGTSCPCGRTTFRIRCIGRSDDMFIVRGVNVYPSAIQDVVGEFRPRVTGRIRAVLPGGGVDVAPPVPIEVEIPAGATADAELADAIAKRLREALVFRSAIAFVDASEFGAAGYKTRSVVRERRS